MDGYFFKELMHRKTLICLMTLYAFVFLITETTVNMRSTMVLGVSSVLKVYGVGLFFSATGYLLYSYLQKKMQGDRQRRITLLSFGILFLLSMGVILFVQDAILLLVFAWTGLLLMGYLAAAAHYFAACALENSRITGKVIGLGMFLAVIMQYFVQQSGIWCFPLTMVSIVGASIGLLYLVYRPARDWIFENPLPYEENPPSFPKTGLVAMFLVFIMTLGFTFTDGQMTVLDAQGELGILRWPRLFYAVGLLLAGYLADIGKRKYLQVTTAIAFSLAMLAAALMLNSAYYNYSVSIMYLYSGFYVIYFTVFFLDIAPKTKNPALWAGMGRIIRSYTSGLVFTLALLDVECGNIFLVITVNVLVSILVLAIAFWQYAQQENDEKEKLRILYEAELTKNNKEKNNLEKFIAKYEFSPREKDVFLLALSGDLKGKDIAAHLYISERVCQKYLTNIYQKTATKSRVGLLLLYYGEVKK